MKTLTQHLNEKLIINKDYRGLGNDYEEFDDEIVDIIKELLDNPEDEDIKFNAAYGIIYFSVITDMIETTYDAYGMRTKKNMCDKIRTTHKFIPASIRPTDYKRALRKSYIDMESQYLKEIKELYEYLIDNNDKCSIKNCDLGDGNLFSTVTNEKYLFSFLLNEKTGEMFELFIIEFK